MSSAGYLREVRLPRLALSRLKSERDAAERRATELYLARNEDRIALGHAVQMIDLLLAGAHEWTAADALLLEELRALSLVCLGGIVPNYYCNLHGVRGCAKCFRYEHEAGAGVIERRERLLQFHRRCLALLFLGITALALAGLGMLHVRPVVRAAVLAGEALAIGIWYASRWVFDRYLWIRWFSQ